MVDDGKTRGLIPCMAGLSAGSSHHFGGSFLFLNQRVSIFDCSEFRVQISDVQADSSLELLELFRLQRISCEMTTSAP